MVEICGGFKSEAIFLKCTFYALHILFQLAWPHDYLECCAFKGCDTLPHTFNSFSSIPFELDLFWSCV